MNSQTTLAARSWDSALLPDREATKGAERFRILFVDDDPCLLNGLRRSLMGRRNEWEMSFVTSGAAALDHMAEHPVDVVVSDMRMPEMDGATLLADIAVRHPHTVRIILSGFADRDAVIKTIGPSHRYLAKPCETQCLVSAIRRSLALRLVLGDHKLRAVIAGLSILPTPPRMFGEILTELESRFASAKSLADKVRGDVALCTQILRLANTAYYARVNVVTEIEKAIQWLGFDTFKALFLFSGIFQSFTGDAEINAVLERVGQRSLKTSELARRIAEREGLPACVIDAITCASLLAHVGTVLLAANFPREFREIAASIDSDGLTVDKAEHRCLNADHAQIGAYLLGLWGFNDDIVEAVAYHHRPGASRSHTIDVLTVLHVAQCLTRAETRPEYLEHGLLQDIDFTYLDDVGATAHIPDWIATFRAVRQAWG